MRKKILFEKMTILSSDDRSFLTHRLPMAMAAKASCHNVWVICKDTGKCDEIRQHGFQVIDLPVADAPLNVFKNFRTLQLLVSIYNKINPDLIYHSSVQMSFLGSLARLFTTNAPAINSITGVGYLFTSKQPRAKFFRRILNPALRILWRRPGTVMLFQNSNDRETFIERGLSEHNAPLIPGSGVDDQKFVPAKAKRNFTLSDQPLVIGCASRLIRDKGIEELIEAIKIVQRNHSIELRIAGDIYPKNPSSFNQKDIAHWGTIFSVHFLGEISDMVDFWQGCDVAILPSHREGFPKALLEAAACGLPVFGAEGPGVREIVVDGHNGLLFAKADCHDIARKIERILLNDEFRQLAAVASRKIIKRKGLSNNAIEVAFIKLFVSIKHRVVFASDK